jgi:hypothetical protein
MLLETKDRIEATAKELDKTLKAAKTVKDLRNLYSESKLHDIEYVRCHGDRFPIKTSDILNYPDNTKIQAFILSKYTGSNGATIFNAFVCPNGDEEMYFDVLSNNGEIVIESSYIDELEEKYRKIPYRLVTDIIWDEDKDMYLEEMLDDFTDNVKGLCMNDRITKNQMMALIENFEEWMDTAEDGATYTYDDLCYVMRKLDITSSDLPGSVYIKDSVSHLEIEDILKDTYGFCVCAFVEECKCTTEELLEMTNTYLDELYAEGCNADENRVYYLEQVKKKLELEVQESDS